MIIEKQRIGAHGKQTIYKLCNSIADTGAERPEEVARFDTLELAAIVMRYIQGGSLTESDEARAREALKGAAELADDGQTII